MRQWNPTVFFSDGIFQPGPKILLPSIRIWTLGDNMGVSKNRETPQNGWFRMETPIKMDDLGVLVPLFSETSIS